jgi:hypothetical protein
MSYGNINDPKHWRDRAAEMHALAETMKDAETIGVTVLFCLMFRDTARVAPETKGADSGR